MRWNYTSLRWYIQGRKLTSPHQLQDCDIVIDGDSYFKEILNKTNGNIIGLNCDSYADLLTKNLSTLLENKVKCYVIFNGAAKVDIEKLKENQQRVINDSLDVDFQRCHYQPDLMKEVQKQILDEMGIKYFVCEYECTEAIVGVARKFKCPVLTNRIEYCLLGVSCIPIYSVEFEEKTKKVNCVIYEHEAVKTMIGVYKKMPVLLTIFHETGDYMTKLSEVIMCGSTDVIPAVRWVRRKREDALITAITSSLQDETDKKAFMELYENIKNLYLYPSCNLAVKYFQRQSPQGLFRDDRKWFAKGVSSGRIAVPYINLKKKGVICGSSLVNDVDQSDAVLAAIDIIAYSHCILTNSQDSTITFIGRNFDNTIIKEIHTHFDSKISNRNIFKSRKKSFVNADPNYFEGFLEKSIPGSNLNEIFLTRPHCSILIISLVYYVHKKNKDFLNGAYSILLSYFLLGRVSYTFDVFKLENILKKETNFTKVNDCREIYNGLQFLFKRVDKGKLDSRIVHSFSEFLHCLQHLNYLNKLCGEKYPSTVYHDMYNATFVYNTFLFMKDKDHLISFLESTFPGSEQLKIYKDLVNLFDKCLAAVKIKSSNELCGKNESGDGDDKGDEQEIKSQNQFSPPV